MGRSPCCSKEGLNRGAWTALEDRILTEYVKVHGEGQWRNLPKRAGLKRCGKSCRLRWLNYLRPDIKRGNITRDEEELIIRLHKLLGNRWSLIAGRLPGRTDNEIKNYWNTRIGKKVLQNRSRNGQFPSSGISQVDQPDHKNKESSLMQRPTSQFSSLNTSVVWTKASKCNKVVLPHEQIIQDSTTPMMMAPPPPPVAHFPADNPVPYPESIPQFTLEENGFWDLTIGFELDEQLLSDLLNTDFSELTNLETGAASDTSTCYDHGQNLSPNSSQTHMFPDDTPNNSDDFRSVDCLTNPWEFDWLLG